MNRTFLPPPHAEIRRQYCLLIDEIERETARIEARLFEKFLQCRPGCSSCCIAISVLPLEAALLAEVLPRQAAYPSDSGDRCPFLRQDRCFVYERRPILCRTQGMALAYLDEETGIFEVSACPLNFSEEYQFSEEVLLFMDGINERLRQLNEDYCTITGHDPFSRIALADIARGSNEQARRR